MKRYLLFRGDTYYPSGGWKDFVGSFDTIDEARARANTEWGDWWHVVDSTTGKVVTHKEDDYIPFHLL